ncbi:hypothetical protein I6U48_24850 [Clostridium sp. PL3]|uniref:Uncharacterized protein n=1 Tax=Clostridium thailandense TaxID=2794346 RepID=A0A949U478_9CLOT|nr:hypothetical protein [Clostridium thailandense]MBV7276119.1 hypothetical protein [Clostridium thailandense]
MIFLNMELKEAAKKCPEKLNKLKKTLEINLNESDFLGDTSSYYNQLVKEIDNEIMKRLKDDNLIKGLSSLLSEIGINKSLTLEGLINEVVRNKAMLTNALVGSGGTRTK